MSGNVSTKAKLRRVRVTVVSMEDQNVLALLILILCL